MFSNGMPFRKTLHEINSLKKWRNISLLSEKILPKKKLLFASKVASFSRIYAKFYKKFIIFDIFCAVANLYDLLVKFLSISKVTNNLLVK